MFIHTGKSISEINFKLFSVDIIEKNNKNFSYKNDFIVLIGGSFMNFFISLICFIINIFFHNEILKLIYIESLFIGILNLMPVSSLDGGRILKILLEKKIEFAIADKISFIISVLFLIPIATLGFLIFLKFKTNPSLLILCVYLISFLINNEPKRNYFNFV
ncbi:MAG: site-2 protease family protein [Oscillospiraceae bacterium]|nr:site-2 protease family protein [Oscillospiraceae bacterium]